MPCCANILAKAVRNVARKGSLTFMHHLNLMNKLFYVIESCINTIVNFRFLNLYFKFLNHTVILYSDGLYIMDSRF